MWGRAAVLLGLVVGCSGAAENASDLREMGAAEAAPVTSAVTLDRTPAFAGLVVVGPGEVVAGGAVACSGTRNCGTVRLGRDGDLALVEARALGPGSRFHHWEGACAGSHPKCLLRLAAGAPLQLQAWFTVVGETTPHSPMVTLRIHLAGSGTGDVTADGYELACEDVQPTLWSNGGCTGLVPAFTPVTLHAHPRPGSTFDRWVGGAPGERSFTLRVGLPWGPEAVPDAVAAFSRVPEHPRYRASPIDRVGWAVDYRGGKVLGGRFDGTRWTSEIRDVATHTTESIPDETFRPRGLSGDGAAFGNAATGRVNQNVCRVFRDGTLVDVPPLPGDDDCWLLGMNARGHAVGVSSAKGGPQRSFFWDGTQTRALTELPGVPPGFGVAGLGGDDEWVGTTFASDGRHGWLVAHGVATELSARNVEVWPSLVGPAGDRVAGVLSHGGDGASAFVWDGTHVTDLGVVLPGRVEAFPKAMNAAGAIVGTFDSQCIGCDYARSRAFVVENGVARDLNEITDTGAFELVEGVGIDDRGRIVVNAFEGGDWSRRAAVLLTPVAESAR